MPKIGLNINKIEWFKCNDLLTSKCASLDFDFSLSPNDYPLSLLHICKSILAPIQFFLCKKVIPNIFVKFLKISTDSKILASIFHYGCKD